MRWMHKMMALPAVFAVAAVLAGCPAPVLRVSPGAVNFAANQNRADLMIHNDGAGTLTWQVEENLPWLSLSAIKQSSAEGTATQGAPSVVELTVDRTGLPTGITRGSITITSNAGTRTIPLSVDVGGPAQLEVSTSTLEFGATATQLGAQLVNRGLEPLQWSVSIPNTAPWLQVTPASGTIQTANGTSSLSFRVNRTGIAPGNYEVPVTINSNGGSATITATMSVVPFSISPASLPLQQIQALTRANISISNLGGVPLAANYAIQTGGTGNWLSIARQQDLIPGNSNVQLEVTVNPAGLAPGTYQGAVVVTASGVSVSVPVSFTVTALEVSTNLIDFGQVPSGSPAPRSFSVSNLGAGQLAYEVTVPAAAQSWLTITPSGPNTVGAAPVVHNVSINADTVAPGLHEAQVNVAFGGETRALTVRFVKQRPARLVVVSQSVNFGTTSNEERIDIWNDGIGVVNWSIDPAGFPAWLTLSGPTSGSVSGDATNTVTLRVNRALAPDGVFDLSHVFSVVATGDFNATVPVTVQATVPQVPRIEVVGQAVDDDGVPFINIDVQRVTATFIVRNNGNGVLNWSINPAQLPAWIASISPLQGGLNPGTEQSVTVTVNRAPLDYLGAQTLISITSNDPTVPNGSVPFIVEVQVPKRVAITSRQAAIAFAADENVSIVEVANNGDAGTVLNYRIRSTKDSFLKVFPETGSSLGTDATLKDFKAHSVAIVRSQLEGNGSSAKLIVEAVRTNEQGQTEVLTDVAPVEITVSVEAAALTFENAMPRLRVPSIARFVLLMRNLRYAPIKVPDTRLPQLANQFQILENDIPVDLDESARVAKPNSFIRGNLLIMLDYSASMQAAARAVRDETISGAPDPLQALYERTISQLIDEIPTNYRVGLAIFSDRDGNIAGLEPLRPIYGTDAEGPATENELFLQDRDLLQDRLANIFVATNGATELYPALMAGGREIFEEDNIAGIFPFDDADDRIILAVTDGRATTPPGQVTDVIDNLRRVFRTRTFVMGWGNDVSTGPLVLLATETGGHIYATQNERVIQGGVTRSIPVVEELEQYCTTIENDPCDLSVKRDLEAQYLLSYVSLNEESNVTIEGRLTFDDPNDQLSPCLPEQGEIDGKFTGEQTTFAAVAGDPRMSQIKLEYGGLQAGNTGSVMVYLDAAGRDLRRLRLQFTPVNATLVPADISVIPATLGGVLGGWNLSNSGLTYTLESPDAPLIYGDFGPMLLLQLRNIQPGARLELAVAEPVYSPGNPNTKFFTYPDSIMLDVARPVLAPSFPAPSIRLAQINGVPTNRQFTRLVTGELFFNLGSDVNTFDLDFYNIGGAHQSTGVGLQYVVSPNAQGLVIQPDNIPAEDWQFVNVYSTQLPQRRRFHVVRGNTLLGPIDGRTSQDPFQVEFEYFLMGIGYGGEMEPLVLSIDVSDAQVQVDANSISFPEGTDLRQVVISNASEGILNWEISSAAPFPAWLNFNSIEGTLGAGQSFTLQVSINRGALPAGPQAFAFDIVSANPGAPSSQTIEVTIP